MKKLLAKALNILWYTLCCLSVVIVLNSYIQKECFGVYQPSLFGYSYATVVSGSMEPNIPTGSFIVIKEECKYQVGDVVTYIDYRGLSITHRVIDVSGDRLVAKGDANIIPDPSFTKDAVIGKVVCHVPKLGFLINILKTPIVVSLLVVFLMICFLWDSTIWVFKRLKCAKTDSNVASVESTCVDSSTADIGISESDV